VATLSVIRRWALREQLSIREISRRSGLSRNTVRKYLQGGAVQPQYAKRVGPSKLDAFAEKLAAWLKTEQSKTRKQKRSLLQVHADLVALGYTGSYGRVAAFARAWRQRQHEDQQTTGRGSFVPLVFAPGEAFQFDWSEDWAVIDGERVKLQVAHFKLCHSRAFWLRAYPLQTHEMLFDAHNHAFAAWGGVPRRGIYDNMRTAVDKIGRGKARDVNARFTALSSHYLFEPQFCNPASGWEKGQVEKNVQDARRRLWQQAPAFADLDALNDWLGTRCTALWGQIAHGSQPGSVADVWAREQSCLMPLLRSFDGFVEHPKRVSPTCLVHFERNRYSVPAAYANHSVSLRVYAQRLVVVAQGKVVCEHVRVIHRRHDGLGQTVYDWRHYLAVLQRKPGALRNGAPFAELPLAFKRLQAALLKQAGGERQMVEILALVLHHDEQAVLTAVELALEAGVPTQMHVLNVLHRLVDGKPAPAAVTPVITPAALRLDKEPQADVLRYDSLRLARQAPMNKEAAGQAQTQEVSHAS
jgi:transposase